jgi:hypothetical protein
VPSVGQRSQLRHRLARARASLKQRGLRVVHAAKAAISILRGSNVVAIGEQQAIWNVAVDTAAQECEQAARLLKLRTGDPSDITNIVVDHFTRQAARIRLLRTDNSRGKRFFEGGRNALR